MTTEPRTVAMYRGAQIRDAREDIHIAFDAALDGALPPGMAERLRAAGWQRANTSAPFVKRSNPTTIFEAQSILREHGFQEEL